MTKKYTIQVVFVLLLFSFATYPQDLKTSNDNRSVFRIMPFYQNWNGSDNTNIKQYSSRLLFDYYYDRYTRISLHSGYASSEALNNTINGLSDMQLSVNYKLRKLNTALDAGINLPTGRERIDINKFPSSILLSQEVLGMKIPLLGQGTNIFAGITWANEISDNVAIGFGASYQIKGKYEPVSGDNTTYNPSNELLLTGGADFRINSSTTISTDLIGIFYGKDKVNNNVAFSAGTRTIFNIIFRQYYGFNNLVVFLRYRNSASDELTSLQNLVSSEKINPNNFMTFVNFNHYISGVLSLVYSVEGRFYQKTIAPLSGYNIYGIGITSNISLSSDLQLPITLKYYTGSAKGSPSINGIDIGLGLVLIF
jgi:hypothetical protein